MFGNVVDYTQLPFILNGFGKIIMWNTNGTIIKTITSNEKSLTIDLSNYPSGAYFLQFIDLDKTIKIIRL